MSLLKEQDAKAKVSCDLCGKEFLVDLRDQTKFHSSFDSPWERTSMWIHLHTISRESFHFNDGCLECQLELLDAIQPVLDRRRALSGNTEALIKTDVGGVIFVTKEKEKADYGTAKTASQVAAVIACRKAGAPDPIFVQETKDESLNP